MAQHDNTQHDETQHDGTQPTSTQPDDAGHRRLIDPDAEVGHDGANRRPEHRGPVATDADRAHEKFGGLNVGAAFFGWIVAIGVGVLLVGIVGAVLAAVGSSVEVTQTEAEREAGTIGVSTAVVVLVILALAYYAGGYVAGRMSRFDGARQGVGVWVLGLVVTIVAVVLGAVFGAEYNVLDRVDLPSVSISTDQLGWAAVIAGVAALLVSLVAAVLGGLLGHRYHDRVDRAARR